MTRPDPRHKITADDLEARSERTGQHIEVDTAADTMHLAGSPLWAELGPVAA